MDAANAKPDSSGREAVQKGNALYLSRYALYPLTHKSELNMVTTHYMHVPLNVDWLSVIDDFGNLHTQPVSVRSWWNAYRFANVVSFEEANMRSYNVAVSEH
jgi:hypothetical protein